MATSSIPAKTEKKPVLPPKRERILSLDVLRGIDLLFLFCIGPIYSAIAAGPLKEQIAASPLWQSVSKQFHHVQWEGFVAWDLIMPLFLFMVGVAIPFSLAKYTTGHLETPTFRLYFRIIRRVILLWILGMIVQGHLLDLNIRGLRLFSNTLQAIAVGYLFACLFYLLFGIRTQIVIALGLLLGFWAIMTYVKTGDYGGGSFAPDTNLAEWVDRTVLGRWRDGVTFNADGTWAFSAGYRYTWILSSMTFVATVMTGLFAGELIRRQYPSHKAVEVPVPTDVKTTEVTPAVSEMKVSAMSKSQIFFGLLVTGLVLGGLGYGWSMIPEGTFGYCPMVKKIWTPSMVLFSSGLSFLLLAVLYGIIDMAGWKWGMSFFAVVGLNAITAYTLYQVIRFNAIAEMVLRGTKQYLGAWYPVLLVTAGSLLLWYILWVMYRCKKYLRV